MKNMSKINIGAVVLAGGQGKRMKSKLPKILHELLGKPILKYSIDIAVNSKANPVYVVIPPENKEIENLCSSLNVKTAVQKKPMGTADAVMSAKNGFNNFNGYILIINGDVPLLKLSTIKKFITETLKSDSICGVCTMKLQNAGNYGRIIRDFDGHLARIVEAKDATPEELSVNEVNAGIYFVESKWLFETLKNISKDNEQGEYYLTDIIGLAVHNGSRVYAYLADDADEFLGINNRQDLDLVSQKLRLRINRIHQEEGVTIIDSTQTYIESDVKIGKDTVIWPYTFLKGKTKIGENCVIENGAVINNSIIESNVKVKSYSVIEDSKIKNSATVGPFTRLRPNSVIGEKSKIGNFVEIKKSVLKKGVKAGHLTYIGDSVVGDNTNVGCGTITCNYDGANKFKTKIGKNVFIGSDTQFIAPVSIGDNSLIAAGTTVTKNVPADSLVISRVNQTVKKGWVKKRKGKK